METRGARVTLCGEREEFQLFRVHFVILSCSVDGLYTREHGSLSLHPRLASFAQGLLWVHFLATVSGLGLGERE